MAVQVNISAPFARRTVSRRTEAGESQRTPSGGRLRSVSKGISRMLVNALSGPGLDDSALPSSFEAPYGRGSRQVRSLWHLPF